MRKPPAGLVVQIQEQTRTKEAKGNSCVAAAAFAMAETFVPSEKSSRRPGKALFCQGDNRWPNNLSLRTLESAPHSIPRDGVFLAKVSQKRCILTATDT